MKAHFISIFGTCRVRWSLVLDTMLAGFLLVTPNFFMALHYGDLPESAHDGGLVMRALATAHTFTLRDWLLWCGVNFVGTALLVTLHRHLMLLRRIAFHVQSVQTTFLQADGRALLPRNIRLLSQDLTRFALMAHGYYYQYFEANRELERSRSIIAMVAQEQVVIATADREVAAQYKAVLAYANYLDEHIQLKKADPALRYDFDDACESSLNLKLVASALQVLAQDGALRPQPVSLAELMQRTMFTLAPSLERRSMKLTTAEVDTSVMAWSDAERVSQILWMILLGTIRYAANESTLRMRCLYSQDGHSALMSIVVSELAPGKLSYEERSAYFVRQLHHLTPHMFAETIRVQANLQLAEMLLKRIDASISILPLTVYACEICVTLPAYTPE